MPTTKFSQLEDAEIRDVRQFHLKFGQIVGKSPGFLAKAKLLERIAFLQEELDELKAAAETNDIALQADALVDLVYVAKGTAVMMGLPWVSLWDDVQRANMAKIKGLTHRGTAFDVAKPPGWVPPKTLEILTDFGYDPTRCVRS